MTQTHATFDDFKVGDTIEIAGTALLPAGDWVTHQPTGWLLDETGTRKADLAIVLAVMGSPTSTENHTITITLSAAASLALAAKLYRTDIRFQDANGVVMHSPTFAINLKSAQTGA
jgi:hypothetical protein